MFIDQLSKYSSPDLAVSARQGTLALCGCLCCTRSECTVMTMLKHSPPLGPWQRIKNTPLVLLTLFKFPASRRPIPAVDKWTHYYWMPLALQVITTLQNGLRLCAVNVHTKRTGY